MAQITPQQAGGVIDLMLGEGCERKRAEAFEHGMYR